VALDDSVSLILDSLHWEAFVYTVMDILVSQRQEFHNQLSNQQRIMEEYA
jgi:hypothetical protein